MAGQAYDAHCGRSGCTCPHNAAPMGEGGCYAGVVDVERPDGSDAAVPCPTCRPEQAAIVARHRDPRERGRQLRARSTGDPWYG